MNRATATKLADTLITQCCIMGIRGPFGRYRDAKNEERLTEAVTRLILRTISEIETAEALEHVKAI